MFIATRVVNLYHLKPGWEDDPQYVYVGRAGKGKDGYFGNPLPGRPLEEYERYLQYRILYDAEFRRRVAGLYGKTLVCFCLPKPCHALILARYAEMLHRAGIS